MASDPVTSARALTVPYRVRFDECGPGGVARASTLARYAQDAAWVHSESLGFDRSWYGARGLTWLVRSIELDIRDPLRMGKSVAVSTEVVGFRRVWAQRRTTFGDAPEAPRAVATTDWAMIDERGRPSRIPTELEEVFGAEPATFTSLRLPSIEIPAGGGPIERSFRVRRRDIDPLDHVNNAVYLDYLDETVVALGMLAHLDRLPRIYRLEFRNSAGPDERLTAYAVEQPVVPGDSVAVGFGLRSEVGGELVRGRLEAERGE